MQVFNQDEIETLHAEALRLLEQIGVRIDHQGARNLLLDAGAQLDGDLVRIPSDLVERAVKKAPGPFSLFAPRGDYSIRLGGEQGYLMTLGGAPEILDYEIGSRRPATSKDLVRAARVTDWAEHIHLFAALFGMADIPGSLVEITEYKLAAGILHKPLTASIYTPTGAQYVSEMAAVVAGGEEALRRKPHVIFSVCPQSPLSMSFDVAEAILIIAGKGLPLSLVPMPVLGVSAPITMAGALAQQHAEILAGLTLAYQVWPGLPILYNGLISPADMRSALTQWGPPEIGLAGAGTAHLARRCHLPCKVYGFGTSSEALDFRNGMERGQNALISALAGASLLGGAGSGHNLLSGSLEQLVIDNEIMSRIRYYLSPITLSPAHLGNEEILQAMGGISFLEQIHTVRHLRAGVLWGPTLLEDDLAAAAHEQVKVILEAPEPDPLPAEVERELESILSHARRELLG